MFNVSLTSQPASQFVSIDLSSDDPSEGSVQPQNLVFTPLNWNAVQWVTVTGLADDIDDGDIPYNVLIGPMVSDDRSFNNNVGDPVAVINENVDSAGIFTTTVTADTSEAGAVVSLSMSLTSKPLSDVLVPLSTSNVNEGRVMVPSGPVTFTPSNWNQPVFVQIAGQDDFVQDGDVLYHFVAGPTTSLDANYDKRTETSNDFRNIDNDVAGLIASSVSGTTSEDGRTAIFTVTLNSEPLTQFTQFDVTPVPASEASCSPTKLIFENTEWNLAKTVTVTGLDDFVADGARVVTVTVGPGISGDANYNGVSEVVLVTNEDNDAQAVWVSAASGSVTEAGGVATFTVRLGSQPTSMVNITVFSTDTSEGIVSPLFLTFSSETWNIVQIVSITGQDDSFTDGDVSFSASFQPAVSGDANYNGLVAPSVSVVCIDDDIPAVKASVFSGFTAETGSTARFSVSLLAQPTAMVFVTFTSMDSTEALVQFPAQGQSLQFTQLNFDVAQDVIVVGQDDSVKDGDQPYSIRIATTSTDSQYQGLISYVNNTNVDDDVAMFVAQATTQPEFRTIETAGSFTVFGVTLSSTPTSWVNASVTSLDSTEGTASTSLIAFTPATWNTPQYVTVFSVDDFIDDGAIVYNVRLGPAVSPDVNYDGVYWP